MRDKTILPTNLLDWPRCSGLLPDQKLILLWLWASPYLSSAGVGFIPTKPASATLGLDPAALAGGLRDLAAAGLLELEEETGEVFVLDWFRFHTFKSPVARRAAEVAIAKVQSARLKNVILEKSRTYLPTATSTITTTVSCTQKRVRAKDDLQGQGRAVRPPPAPPAAGACVRKKPFLVHGITCWNHTDSQQANELFATYGQPCMAEALDALGGEVLPSQVAKFLKGKANGNNGNQQNADVYSNAIRSGLAYYGLGERDSERVVAGEVVE